MAVICHPGLDRVNVFENLGKAAAMPALPWIRPYVETSQTCICDEFCI